VGDAVGGGAVIRAVIGRVGVVLAFVWGFAEGTLFFLIPDIIVTFAGLFAPKCSWKHLLAVVAGSLVAGGIMFGFGAQSPRLAIKTVNAVPFVTDGMVEKVAADFGEHGVWAMLMGPTSGVPYKLYAVTAPQQGIGFAEFMVVSVPARLERLVITWLLFGIVGFLFRRFWERRPSIGVAVHALYWIVVYTIYWSRIG
jgi:membrane protein YqaA with SNARE-associated domain